MIENGLMFFRAYVRLLFVDFGLRYFGFQQTVTAVLKRQNPTENIAVPLDRERISKIVQIAQKTFRLYIRSKTECLERSLVICYLLRQEGIPAHFCIGCTKYPPLNFHAWVECGGQIVNDLDSIKKSYKKISVR